MNAPKRFLFSLFTLVFAFPLFSATRCKADAPDDLRSKPLVDAFYKANSGELFWFGKNGGLLRDELAAVLDSAATLGLEPGDYHNTLINAFKNSTAADSTQLWRMDRLFSDAFILLCRDLHEGHDATRMVAYDELSKKARAQDDRFLLTQIDLLIKSANLRNVIAGVIDGDSYSAILQKELRMAMANSGSSKVRQLRAALNLYRWIKHFRFEKYMVVNVASATMGYYEHGNCMLASKVIVGKPSTKTPRFAAYCNEAILYPYWNVPHKIAVNELLPKFKRHPAAIDAMNMQAMGRDGREVNWRTIDWSAYSRATFPYGFRQSTGCDNSLGVIKFNLTDPFDVYMHDTNAKGLFNFAARYFSHGCIRVEQAIPLGNYLLPNRLDDDYLTSCLKNQKPVYVPLEKPVPVFVIYSTVEVNETGDVRYDKDVYGLFK